MSNTQQSLSYLNKDSLDVFELLIILREGHVRYIPWDKYQNSIRNLHGDLFIVEHNTGWYMCFLCASQLEDSQLSKRLYEMVTKEIEQSSKRSTDEQEFIGENQDDDGDDDCSVRRPNHLCVDLSRIKLVRFSPQIQLLDSIIQSPDSNEFDKIDDDLLFTIKLRSGAVVPLVFSKNKNGLESISRFWNILKNAFEFRISDYDTRTFIVDNSHLIEQLNIISSSMPRSSSITPNLGDLDRRSRDHFVSKVLHSPQTTILDELSKVTQFFRSTLVVKNHHGSKAIRSDNHAVPKFIIDYNEMNRYAINTMHIVQPLDRKDFSNLTHTTNKLEELRQLSCKNGLKSDLRPIVWNIFLGRTSIDQTEDELVQNEQQTHSIYQTVLSQWKSMLPDQIERNSVFRDRRNQILKDIHRIPQAYFDCLLTERDRPDWMAICENVLISFSIFNNDVGYSQAFADMLAILINAYKESINENQLATESVLFNVLCSLMQQHFAQHFSEQDDHAEILKHLSLLRKLLECVDPELASYLERNNSLNMFFCFRWLIVWFAREFQLDDVIRLWDCFLSGYPCDFNFDILISFALIAYHRDELMAFDRDFDGILGFFNDLLSTSTVSNSANPSDNHEQKPFNDETTSQASDQNDQIGCNASHAKSIDVARLIQMALNIHDQLNRSSDKLPKVLRKAFQLDHCLPDEE